MREFPFALNGQGVLEPVAGASQPEKADLFWFAAHGKGEGREPNSVLDHGRSPSPPTSTSTFSSSPHGSGGVGAAPEDALRKWVPSGDAAGGGWRKVEWAAELQQPIPTEVALMGYEKCCLGMETWDNMLAEPLPPAAAAAFPPHETPALLRWILGDSDDLSSIALKQQQVGVPPASSDFDGSGIGGYGAAAPAFGLQQQLFGIEPLAGRVEEVSDTTTSPAFTGSGFPFTSSNNGGGVHLSAGLPLCLSAPNGFPSLPRMSNLFSPNVVLNQNHHNPAFFLPSAPCIQAENPQLQLMAQPNSQFTPKFLVPDTDRYPFLQPLDCVQQRHIKPEVAGDGLVATVDVAHHHHQQFLGQLLKAAEMVEAGNFANAREILARLNHQQLSPEGSPLLRSAFYFKEALNSIMANNSPNMPFPSSSSLQRYPLAAPATPLDVVLKLSAYKAFSEVSPMVQFTSFTCIQAILEELNGCDHIHIVDFDIGVGGQWSSFIEELSQRRCAGAVVPSLRITAFVSPSYYHPLELLLARENLSCFASSLSISFELNILSIDSFNPAVIRDMSSSDGEVIAVNIPASSPYILTPLFLRLVKQISPRIVVSVDNCCDRSDLSFSQHFANALQACAVLLESIDASGANSEVVNKIEQFILQPRIESTVLGRYYSSNKRVPWQSMFASVNFLPLPFSNFTETQAECLLKRVHARGFHIEKRQSSLFLLWQRKELASVSAWRC